jgi:hypothetical protein
VSVFARRRVRVSCGPSPQLTFAELAARWLTEFESKVAAGERRERTLELYRGQLERHLLRRLGRRNVQLITADELAALVAELQASGLGQLSNLPLPLANLAARRHPTDQRAVD